MLVKNVLKKSAILASNDMTQAILIREFVRKDLATLNKLADKRETLDGKQLKKLVALDHFFTELETVWTHSQEVLYGKVMVRLGVSETR